MIDANGRESRVAHWASRTDLPKPVGASSRIRGPALCSSLSSSRGRSTRLPSEGRSRSTPAIGRVCNRVVWSLGIPGPSSPPPPDRKLLYLQLEAFVQITHIGGCGVPKRRLASLPMANSASSPDPGDSAAASLFGNRFITEEVPDRNFPDNGMASQEAKRLIGEELVLEGDPSHNLASFVTTWMEPEAQRIIAANLHRNFIDHAEYPCTAEIEKRCIRMLADLFHAPGETTGARTQGSSEAIMLGALSLKWKWRVRQQKEGRPDDRPNLVFGGDVHVVWEKFCRYFDVEPRIVPLQEGKYTIGPEDVEPHLDENTIGVAAVLGTTFTGHKDDITGIDRLLVDLKGEKGLDVPLHVDAASGGFVWPFLYPESEWDFRPEQVRSINVSGHKFGLVYPGSAG